MMGPRQVEQGTLFYNFSLDGHVRPITCSGRWTGSSIWRG